MRDEMPEALEKWEQDARIYRDTRDKLKDNPEQFVDDLLDWVDQYKEPAERFARLVRVVTFLNEAMAEEASLLDQLGKWLKKLVTKLRKIASDWGCRGFVVGAGTNVPPGLPISIYVEVGFERAK